MKLAATFLLASLAIGTGWLLNAVGPLGAGMVAKTLCSSVYVSGLPAERVYAEELEPYWYVGGSLQPQEHTAQASLAGMFARTAYYAPGAGCVLDRRPTAFVPASRPATDQALLPATDAVPLALGPVIQQAFAEPYETDRVRTRAVLVLYKGRILAEQYAPGITAGQPLIGWSMTKSLLNLLTGAMVQNQLLRIREPVQAPEWPPGDPRMAISVLNLLQMSSGLAFDETYGPFGDPGRMLYTQEDFGHFAADRPALDRPDQIWSYSSGTSNLLARFVRHKLEEQGFTQRAYLQQYLLDPVGITDTVVEADPSGTLVASSFGYMSARSWARLGQLMLDDGVAGTQRVLPPGWAEYSCRPAPAAPAGQYGAHFWVNARDTGLPGFFPSLPPDTCFMMGYQGQTVAVFPSRDLVVVRLGMTHKRSDWDTEEFLASVLAVLP